MLFDKVIAFDNLKQEIILIVNAKTDGLEQNYRKAQLKLDEMVHLIKQGTPEEIKPLELKSEFHPLSAEGKGESSSHKSSFYEKRADASAARGCSGRFSSSGSGERRHRKDL